MTIITASVVVGSPSRGGADTVGSESERSHAGGGAHCTAPGAARRVLPSQSFFLRGQRPKRKVLFVRRGEERAPTEPGPRRAGR